MLFDSRMAFSAAAISWRMRGIASSSMPCRVRTHSERAAPETRNLDESLSPLRSRSSVTAQELSSQAHWHGLPLAEQTPCPYWVIFMAVQRNSGSAAIRPATTLVLPTLRECPPTTIKDINRNSISPYFDERHGRQHSGFFFAGEARQRAEFLQVLTHRACRSSP